MLARRGIPPGCRACAPRSSLKALSRIGEEWLLTKEASQFVAADVENVMAREQSTTSNISTELAEQRAIFDKRRRRIADVWAGASPGDHDWALQSLILAPTNHTRDVQPRVYSLVLALLAGSARRGRYTCLMPTFCSYSHRVMQPSSLESQHDSLRTAISVVSDRNNDYQTPARTQTRHTSSSSLWAHFGVAPCLPSLPIF